MVKKEKLIIVGAGASGKDYLANQLSKKLKRSVSYTTRPIRKGETNGKDYNFVTIEDFKLLIDNNDLYEYEIFKENWYYGTTNDDWNKSQIFIKTVGGVNQIKKEDRDKCFIVFLDINEDIRIERLNKRNDFNDDILRRIKADTEDLSGFKDWDIKITDPNFNCDNIYDMIF